MRFTAMTTISSTLARSWSARTGAHFLAPLRLGTVPGRLPRHRSLLHPLFELAQSVTAPVPGPHRTRSTGMPRKDRPAEHFGDLRHQEVNNNDFTVSQMRGRFGRGRLLSSHHLNQHPIRAYRARQRA
jgi:hypothetical protein